MSGRIEDAVICPVSTQYDKVIETEYVFTHFSINYSTDIHVDLISANFLASQNPKKT